MVSLFKYAEIFSPLRGYSVCAGFIKPGWEIRALNEGRAMFMCRIIL